MKGDGPVVVILLAAVVVWAASSSVGAECIAPPPPCVALKDADMVFHARVVRTAWVTPGSTADGNRVTFEVLRGFKGIAGKQYTAIFNATNAEAFQFNEGTVVVVYARHTATDTWQTACSRTTGFLPGGRDRADAQAVEDEVAHLVACSSRP